MSKLSFGRVILSVILASSVLLASACTAAPAATATTAPDSPETTARATSAVTSADTTAAPAETTAAGEKTQIRIAALKGPTGIGLVNLMAAQDEGTAANDYTFSLSGSPDDIVARLSSGQADIAALPTNLAAVLYQKTNQSIQMLAVNTLGVLYILENGDDIRTMADLSGDEILATGQGSVPEYVLNDLLAASDLEEPATVTYKAEHAELATLAASGKADIVMLPEPFVTTVLSKNPDMRIALDLTGQWQEVHGGSSASELAMGCLVVTKAFAQAHPDALISFMTEYEVSAEQVNADPAAAGQLVAQYQIMADAALAEKAIPNCHIVMIQGAEMQSIMDPFLAILMEANPKSIGGKLPDAGFYWIP